MSLIDTRMPEFTAWIAVGGSEKAFNNRDNHIILGANRSIPFCYWHTRRIRQAGKYSDFYFADAIQPIEAFPALSTANIFLEVLIII